MDFGANKTTVKVVKEGAFGRTYLRDIFSDVNGKWYRRAMERIWSVEKYLSEVLLLKFL